LIQTQYQKFCRNCLDRCKVRTTEFVLGSTKDCILSHFTIETMMMGKTILGRPLATFRLAIFRPISRTSYILGH
jgi:hypothetical protein